MRLLLDAKDLIELVERRYPMSADEFAAWLNERDAKVVLTFTNVSEFADCFAGVDDLLYIRSMVQQLERLPLTYLHEALIELNEIELAIAAFDRGDEPARPDPYVPRWDYTFRRRGERPPGEMFVGLRLDEMTFFLFKQPDSHRRRLPALALKAIRDERAIPHGRRLPPRKALTTALENKIRFWQLPMPAKGIEPFGKWIFADPSRCPGFRLGWELFRALSANERDELLDSDLWDNAHFPAVPYVDYVTLDRRMTGYCCGISKRLAKQNCAIDYDRRVFRTLNDLVGRLG